jgi:CspA family cold shock protein
MSDEFEGRYSSGQTGVAASVKWFNPTKGFGFVQLADGDSDAFLHISVVERFGERTLPNGATVMCQVTEGQRGLQVAEIYSIDLSTATDEPPSPARHAPPQAHGPATTVEGMVKFFDAQKGFGFVTPDDGSRDVFVSARVLEHAGIAALQPRQRVRIDARMGDRGPLATSIELL